MITKPTQKGNDIEVQAVRTEAEESEIEGLVGEHPAQKEPAVVEAVFSGELARQTAESERKAEEKRARRAQVFKFFEGLGGGGAAGQVMARPSKPVGQKGKPQKAFDMFSMGGSMFQQQAPIRGRKAQPAGFDFGFGSKMAQGLNVGSMFQSQYQPKARARGGRERRTAQAQSPLMRAFNAPRPTARKRAFKWF